MKTKQSPIVCPSCKGSCVIPEPFGTSTSCTRQCPACNGSGVVTVMETESEQLPEVPSDDIIESFCNQHAITKQTLINVYKEYLKQAVEAVQDIDKAGEERDTYDSHYYRDNR